MNIDKIKNLENQLETVGWDVRDLLSDPIEDVHEAVSQARAFLDLFLPPDNPKIGTNYQPTFVYALPEGKGYAGLSRDFLRPPSRDFRKAFGGHKICYHVNICDPELFGKASKFAVQYTHAVLIDIEPKGKLIDQAFLDGVKVKIGTLNKEHSLTPAFVIFTGNGIHVIYFLPRTVRLPEISAFHYALASGNDTHIGKGLRSQDREDAKAEMRQRCKSASETEREKAREAYVEWLAVVEPVEAKWRWLNDYFGGDTVANIDRVAGLPGTLNPKYDKASSRKPRTVRVIEYNDAVISKAAWAALPEKEALRSAVRSGGGSRSTHADPHVQYVIDRITEIASRLNEDDLERHVVQEIALPPAARKIVTDLAGYQAEKHAVRQDGIKQLSAVQSGKKLDMSVTDPNKNAGVMSFVLSVMLSNRMVLIDKVKTCLAYMTDRERGGDIAVHIHNQAGEPLQVARRQLARIMAQAAPGIVDRERRLFELNERHAAIRDVGGKFRIAFEHVDGGVSFQTPPDMALQYANSPIIKIAVEDGKEEVDQLPLAPTWIAWPWRREYDRMDVCPDGAPPNVYNLWKGFPAEYFDGETPDELNTMDEPDCLGIYLDYVFEVLANEDEAFFHYLLDFQADMLINPGRKPETMPALWGEEGTGKSKFGDLTRKLVGLRNSFLATDAERLMKNFNRHLMGKVFIHADEALFSGDPRHVKKLLNMVTATCMPVEPKGVDVFDVGDLSRYLATSNDPKLVHVSNVARRFAVQEVSNKHKEDKPYFARLDNWFDEGGRVQLAKWYLSPAYRGYLSKNDLRLNGRPKTAALAKVQALSLGPVDQAIMGMLQEGEPPCAYKHEEGGVIAVHVKHWVELIKSNLHRNIAENEIRSELKAKLEKLGSPQPKDNRTYFGRHSSDRQRAVWLPPLKIARENFMEHIARFSIDWENDDEKWSTNGEDASEVSARTNRNKRR